MSSLPFAISGTVIQGKHLGSELGFPTANIAYEAQDRDWPKEGVYVGIAQPDGADSRYLAILNQGKHPTAPGGVPTVEVHMLGFPYQALYGKRLNLSYQLFLRPEQTFPSLIALKDQLQRDREAAIVWARQNEPALVKIAEASKGD